MDVIEAVRDWHACVTAKGSPARPFIWASSDCLRIVRHGLDFLGSEPRLKVWFGPDYPFRDNPFSMAYSLSERPVTPRPFMVKKFVNGKTIQVVSPSLQLESEREAEEIERVWDRAVPGTVLVARKANEQGTF